MADGGAPAGGIDPGRAFCLLTGLFVGEATFIWIEKIVNLIVSHKL